MSRLIDADKLIEELGTSDREIYCKEIIAEAPIAYDLDKVVRELEEKYDSIPIQYERNYDNGLEDGYAESIEIVKRGGIDG